MRCDDLSIWTTTSAYAEVHADTTIATTTIKPLPIMNFIEQPLQPLFLAGRMMSFRNLFCKGRQPLRSGQTGLILIPAGPRFGYGSRANVPTVQMAAATPVYTQAPVAAAQPAPLPRPVMVALAALPPAPVYTAPVSAPTTSFVPPQPRAVASAPPARPAYTPPREQRTVVAQVEQPRATPRRAAPQRVALASPPRKSGGFHLISSAVAAEVYPARRAGKAHVVPAAYTKPAAAHGRQAAKPAWKLQAKGPVQAAPACHKTTGGKMVCGPSHL